MAKNKQQKKKERERRVAKKKLAAAQKRAEAKSEEDQEKGAKPKKVFSVVQSTRVDNLAAGKQQPVTHRRIGS